MAFIEVDDQKIAELQAAYLAAKEFVGRVESLPPIQTLQHFEYTARQQLEAAFAPRADAPTSGVFSLPADEWAALQAYQAGLASQNDDGSSDVVMGDAAPPAYHSLATLPQSQGTYPVDMESVHSIDNDQAAHLEWYRGYQAQQAENRARLEALSLQEPPSAPRQRPNQPAPRPEKRARAEDCTEPPPARQRKANHEEDGPSSKRPRRASPPPRSVHNSGADRRHESVRAPPPRQPYREEERSRYRVRQNSPPPRPGRHPGADRRNESYPAPPPRQPKREVDRYRPESRQMPPPPRPVRQPGPERRQVSEEPRGQPPRKPGNTRRRVPPRRPRARGSCSYGTRFPSPF